MTARQDDEPAQRVVPYVCPFCAEEDLRPEPAGRWHCRACLRVFSVAFHGLLANSLAHSDGSDE